MSSLKQIDKIKLEKLLGMSGGYVCDFSDRTFGEFVIENTGVNIFTDAYTQDGTSKANRLRTFWIKESDEMTANLIEALLEYWKTQQLISGKDIQLTDNNLYLEGKKIVQNLHGIKPTELKRVTIGIIDEGKDNYYENVSTEGFDIGFHDKGVRTKIIGGQHVFKNDKNFYEKNTMFERITNNQTFAIIFGTIILLIILYYFYKYLGIDLSQFK